MPELDPFVQAAEAFHAVRADWSVATVARFLREQSTTTPRLVLLLALADGCKRTREDGTYILTTPNDIFNGPWLTAALAASDQYDAHDRVRRGKTTAR